ncbi:hypothetical protein F4818DRAFT_445194 [Hypoxylon cercidicola]|nr:hypothetical protein F4818DRAFT_445194 [Hypoxylon cercidicola]
MSEDNNETENLTISLLPTPEDKRKQGVTEKYDIEELVTYSTHASDVQENAANHPDLEAPNNQPLETFPQPVAPRLGASQHDYQPAQQDIGLRVLAIPGKRPHLDAASIKNKTFAITDRFGMAKPFLAFEDLCRALVEGDKSVDLQNADLATDTETLWAIFETIHQKVSNAKIKNGARGICLAIHIEDATTFIKVLNLYEIDDKALVAATEELKKARKGHPLVKVGPSNTSEALNVFKRVVQYGWRGTRFIVQDENQINHSATEPNRPEGAPAANGPLYALFEYGRQPTEVLGLFAAHKTANIDKKIHRALCHLWFSSTRTARIAEFGRSKGKPKTGIFDGKASFTDATALQLAEKDDNADDSKLTAWAKREDIQTTLRCLHRVLKQILKIAADQQYQGNKKFAVQHVKMADDVMKVKLKADYLTVDLVSETMVQEVRGKDDW